MRLLRAAVGGDGPIEPSMAEWGNWIELARVERVIPMLHHIVTTAEIDLSSEQREMTTAMQLEVMGTMVRFEHDLLEVAQILSDVRCPFAVVKGAATAHLDYITPELRQFGDVDLLVAPQDLLRACTALGEQNWTQAYPLPRHHERFTHAITLRNAQRVEVDLHQHIAHRAIGQLVPTRDLLAATVEYEVAGRTLRALSAEDRLIHAAIHALTSRGPFRRLSSIADVLVLAEANCHAAEAVLERCDRWKVRSLVVCAIESAYAEAALPVPNAWQTELPQPQGRHDWLVDRAYLSPRRRPVTEELAYLRLMPGWRDRFQYLTGYLATDADYAHQKQRSGVVAQSRYLWSRLRSKT